MWALVLECSPALLGVPPQHQALPQQLDGVRLERIQVVHKRHWVPLLGPVKLGLFLSLHSGTQWPFVDELDALKPHLIKLLGKTNCHIHFCAGPVELSEPAQWYPVALTDDENPTMSNL